MPDGAPAPGELTAARSRSCPAAMRSSAAPSASSPGTACPPAEAPAPAGPPKGPPPGRDTAASSADMKSSSSFNLSTHVRTASTPGHGGACTTSGSRQPDVPASARRTTDASGTRINASSTTTPPPVSACRGAPAGLCSGAIASTRMPSAAAAATRPMILKPGLTPGHSATTPASSPRAGGAMAGGKRIPPQAYVSERGWGGWPRALPPSAHSLSAEDSNQFPVQVHELS